MSDAATAGSNTVYVRVTKPDARERAVLDALWGDPSEIRLGWGRAQRLLQEYPESRYLQAARVERYLSRESKLRDSPSNVGRPYEAVRAEQAATYREMLDELLSQNWTGHEDARLGLVARFAARAGDAAEAAHAQAEILKRFPDSPAEDEVRREKARMDGVAPK